MSKSAISSRIPYFGISNYDTPSSLENEMEASRHTATHSTSKKANIAIHEDQIEFNRHSRELILSEVKKAKKSDDDNVLVICSSSGNDAALFTLRFDTKEEISKVLEFLKSYAKSSPGISFPLNPERNDTISNSNASVSLTRLPKSRARSNSNRGNISQNSRSNGTNSIEFQKPRISTNKSSFFHTSRGERSFEIQKSFENSKYRNRSSSSKSIEITTPPAEIQIKRETPKKSFDTSSSKISSSTSTLNWAERVPTRQKKFSADSVNQFVSGKKEIPRPIKVTVESRHDHPRRGSTSSSSTCGLSMKTSMKRSKDATQGLPRYRVIDSTQDSRHDDDIGNLTETSGYCEDTIGRSLPVHCIPDLKVVFPVCCKICCGSIEKQHACIPMKAIRSYCHC
ncbi:unnamed protein product [Rodentolepis nana]|uniref:DUF5734 domain-containing protein n=1 Tax=Rodentolepis nana TaxID=102285 RepID=A0A0R3T9K0_RODNA|nr:unnamed protein product [Rodentolepis nana]